MINSCWIDPKGEIHPVDFHKHGKFAQKQLGETCHPEQAIIKLARHGWLHIGLAPFVSFKACSEINDQQFRALLEVRKQCTCGIIEQNITSYIHA